MIEMLGVLAIIGVLSAGGIMGYTTAMEKHKVNETISDIQNSIRQAQYLFSTNAISGTFYDHLPIERLKQLNLIPQKYKQIDSSYCIDRRCFKSPIGPSYWRYESATTGTSWSYFGVILPAALWLQFYDISKRSCVNFLTSAELNNLGNFTILTNKSWTISKVIKKPLTPQEAEVFCEELQINIHIFFKGRIKPE